MGKEDWDKVIREKIFSVEDQSYDTTRGWQRMEQRLVPKIYKYKKWYWAAAALFVILGTSAYWLLSLSNDPITSNLGQMKVAKKTIAILENTHEAHVDNTLARKQQNNKTPTAHIVVQKKQTQSEPILIIKQNDSITIGNIAQIPIPTNNNRKLSNHFRDSTIAFAKKLDIYAKAAEKPKLKVFHINEIDKPIDQLPLKPEVKTNTNVALRIIIAGNHYENVESSSSSHILKFNTFKD